MKFGSVPKCSSSRAFQRFTSDDSRAPSGVVTNGLYNPMKKIRATLILAQTFAKHGVLFVPVICETEEEHAQLLARVMKKLDEMEAAEEKH